MANVNKVILIGRLTRDPEVRVFSTGGKVAKFGFAVTNRKKNSQTGQWEDDPMYIDCDAFNRGEFGKTADTVEQYLRKGQLAYIEGKLILDQWDDKNTGQKRSKHKMVVDFLQMLERQDRGGGPGGPGPGRPAQSAAPASPDGGFADEPPTEGGEPEGEIPF